MDRQELQEVLEFAVEAAQLAGSLTLGYFNTEPAVELKADLTPVTAADRGAEELLRTRIARAFPRHGILGEELGEEVGVDPGRWIIDPIDGTYSFICGVPLYAVLVAFEWAGEAVCGVIHLPALSETVWAAKGLGCHWNGRRARVSRTSDMARARLVHGGVHGMHECGRGREFSRLMIACHQDRGWCDAYGYALVATGRAEIALDPAMKLWDTAALLPVITEAGGTLTDWRGQPTYRAPEAVATNGVLLGRVLELLNG